MDNTDRLRSFSSPTGPRPSKPSTPGSGSSSSSTAHVQHSGAAKSGLYAVEISPALLAKSPPKTPAPPPPSSPSPSRPTTPTTPTTTPSALSLSLASARTSSKLATSRSGSPATGLVSRVGPSGGYWTPPPSTASSSSASASASIMSPSSATMVQQVAKPRQINQDRMEDASIGNSPMYSNLHEVMLRHSVGAASSASLQLRDADLLLDDADLDSSLLALSSDSSTPTAATTDPYVLATERLLATIERVEALQHHSVERNLLMMQVRGTRGANLCRSRPHAHSSVCCLHSLAHSLIDCRSLAPEQKHRSAAFLEAVRTGDVSAVRRSITYGVDVNLKDQFSVSALHHAGTAAASIRALAAS